MIVQEQQKMVKKIKHYIYDPLEVVGSGFSSKVFKGVNELTQETIAIKVLELAKIQSEVEKYLLNNQINALRALAHPHVLRTVEILMTKNNVYIMTEFCEGGDLQQHVKKQGRLSELEALHLARDIADGYLAIEQKLIVHRDLKTANIFLTPTGARIADFGFCQFLNETKKPQLFYNVGSPAYMSPESYRENVYSAKSDIWSLGIILYEMLTGDTPDKNLTYSQMSNNLMAGRIACSNEDIRHILSLCFKRDLKERIGTVQLLEMINAEIMKLEGGLRVSRPQTVVPQPGTPQSNPVRLVASTSMHPLEPLRNNNNRQMVSSTLPPQEGEPVIFRGQSPLKARFNNIMAREQSGRNVEPSPVKFIDRRFSREEEQPRAANRVKSVTDLLIFLYRLLNALGEVPLERSSTMRMIFFRHRNFLEGQAERITEEQHLDRASFEPLRQFHFLKGKFDDAYLQKQAQSPLQISPGANRLQEMANTPFTDLKALQIYCGLTLQASNQCETRLYSSEEAETNRIGVLFDYLLLHFEILELYSQSKPLQAISQQYLQLPILLKDQPKRITPYHLVLLRHKLKLASKQFQQFQEALGQQKHEVEDTPGYKQLAEIPQRKALMINGFF